MNNLYTITLNFSDHLIGMDQIDAPSPEEALQKFLVQTECLEGYDRSLLINHLNPLLHFSGITGDSRMYKGLWGFSFSTHEIPDLQWPGDNPILGGHIIQTDPNGPIRELNGSNS